MFNLKSFLMSVFGYYTKTLIFMGTNLFFNIYNYIFCGCRSVILSHHVIFVVKTHEQ